MKRFSDFQGLVWTSVILASVWALLGPVAERAAAAERPRIERVRSEGADVVLEVTTPVGVRKLTLESRRQLQGSGWEPRAVLWVDGNGGTVEFRLARLEAMEVLRVRGDAAGVLPESFFRGTNEFYGLVQGTGVAGDNFNLPPSMATDATAVRTGAPAEGGSTRQVVESDIWKVQGDTLYFFNQLRGLQIVDIRRPDAPVLQGTVSMPASGEQMYVLESGHVVLLAANGCGWWGADSESRVVLVDTRAAAPAVVASLPVAGNIRESRLVGQALYVASESYRRIELPPSPSGVAGEQWEWGTTITSFDLADPAKPVARGSIWLARYGSVVMATDRFFFIAVQDAADYWKSTIRVIDISAPDGSMREVSSIQPGGRVEDKFKMALNDDVFTVVTENFSDTRRPLTRVQTYSLAAPAAPAKLGSLDLGFGERLFATRFDGDKVYIVTFFQIDPLWIVDLSDPRTPRISGELEVPGWSTYIHPLGDRLLAVGVETNRVTVSLFDVRDPQRPGLLSKVRLGENYSWSEANQDEKAVTVLEDAGLVLLPYQGNTVSGYASKVQLIDLGPDTLVARGAIEHSFQPRRATLHQGRVVSVSGYELLTVDVSNRDKPAVTAELELAWGVDRVFARGEYLVEVNRSRRYGAEAAPTLRVVRGSALTEVLSRVELEEPWEVVGAKLEGDRLHVLQVRQATYEWPEPAAGEVKPTEPVLVPGAGRHTVFDVAALPQLKRLGATDFKVSDQYWGELTAVSPKPGLVVWVLQNGGWWGPWWGRGVTLDIAVDSRMAMPGIRPWGGSGGGRMIAIDVTDPAAPAFRSEVEVQGQNSWWNLSAPYAANGMVYVSHQTTEFLEGVLPPGTKPAQPTFTYDSARAIWLTNDVKIGTWVTRYYLDVVDYADAFAPVVRRPVSLPGELRGVANEGALLYTVGYRADLTTFTSDSTEFLSALAYDGTAAFLVDSMALSSQWPHAVVIAAPWIYVSRPATEAKPGAGPGVLETWALGADGKLRQALPTVALALPPYELRRVGNLLAARSDQGVEVLDISGDVGPVEVGSGAPKGCVWFDLANADGVAGDGLYLPLGDLGVWKLELKR